MRKHTYLVLLLFLFIVLPPVARAYCSDADINEFKSIESQFKVTYKYNKDTDDFSIYMSMPNTDKFTYGRDESSTLSPKLESYSDDTIVMVIEGYKEETYTYYIIGVTPTCLEGLKAGTITMAKYNTLSDDPLCEGNEDFVLCNPEYDKEVDYDTFVSRIETYEKTKEKKAQQEAKESTEEQDNKIVDYIEDNLTRIIIIGVFVVAVIITIILTIKSARKSRRLE